MLPFRFMDPAYGTISLSNTQVSASNLYYPSVPGFSNVSNFSNTSSNSPSPLKTPFNIRYADYTNSVIYELYQTATTEGFFTHLRSSQMNGSSSNLVTIQTGIAGLESWIFSHVKSFVVHSNYFLIYAGDLNGGVYPGNYSAESAVAHLFTFQLVGSNLDLVYSYDFPYKWANIQNYGDGSNSSNLYKKSEAVSGSNLSTMFQYMCAKFTPCMAIDDSFTVYIGTSAPYYSIISFRGTDFPPSFTMGFTPSSGGISIIGGNLYTGEFGDKVDGSTQLTAEYTTVAQVGFINSMCYVNNKIYLYDLGGYAFQDILGFFVPGSFRILTINTSISTLAITSLPMERETIFYLKYWSEVTSNTWPYISQVSRDTASNMYFIYTNSSNERHIAKITSNAIINITSYSNFKYITHDTSAWNLVYSSGMYRYTSNSVNTNTIFNSVSNTFIHATMVGNYALTWTPSPLNSILGEIGSNDGSLSNAQINPGSNGIIFARNRSFSTELIFIIDGQRIRKIDTTSNTLTTMAGQYNITGYSNGVGTAALFNNPKGICVDSSGNIYVSDTGNLVIRKITQGSNVTTVAGQFGVSGSIDGYASNMTFTHPTEMSMYAANQFVVLDIGAGAGGTNLIRRVVPNGNASTESIVITGAYSVGTILVADALQNIYTNGSVIQISPAGNTTLFSSASGVTSIAIDVNNNVFTTSYNDASNITVINVLSPAGSNLGTYTFAGQSTSLVLNEDTGVLTNYNTTTNEVNTVPLTTFLSDNFYNSNIPCFLSGTTILCCINGNDTYVPIENIRKGMRVKTLKHGYMPVDLIGYSRLYNNGSRLRNKHQIYVCTPENYPELLEPLYITGCHSILVNTLTESQRNIIVDTYGRVFVTDSKYRLEAYLDPRAKPWSSVGLYKIWHIALENTNDKVNYGIYANGLLVESICKYTMEKSSQMTLLRYTDRVSV